jgi:hypothetical protein
MPQSIILKNLVKFVALTEKKFSADLKTQLAEAKDHETREKLERQLEKHQAEFPPYFKELKEKFSQGMCMGFSICHNIMDEEGELEWWENALRLVADWKNEPLDNKIVLLNKKTTTRSQLFTRVFNYIYFSQPQSGAFKSLSSFLPTNMSQQTLLKPTESKSLQTYYTLDYLDRKDQLKTIKKNVVIAGSFTIEQLEKLLAPNLRENILGVVHSQWNRHIVRIGKKNKEYIIYDANFDHTTFSWLNFLILHFSNTAPIYKKFKSLNEMLQELIKIQGTTLGIELASFSNEETFDMSYYDELVSTSPDLLIKDGGLHHIALHNPALCKTICAQAKSSAILESALATELERSIHKTTGLHVISRYSPKTLPMILSLAENKEAIDIRHKIADALSMQTPHGFTALHLIAYYSKEALPKLFSLAESKEGINIRQKIAKALPLQSSNGWTGLHMLLLDESPTILPRLLNWIEDKETLDIRQPFITALTLRNPNHMTALNFIDEYTPELLPKLIKSIEKDEQLLELFNKAIRNSENLKSEAIKKYITRRNMQMTEAKESIPVVIPDNSPILKPNPKPADVIEEKKQIIKTQDQYYSRFFQPILIGAIIGGATAGFGGAIILPAAAYLVPKAQNAFGDTYRKYKRS